MNSLPLKHSLGIEFFRFSDLESLDANGYFDCLDLLRPLFKNSDFRNSTPGFYINHITNRKENDDDGKDSVRLTYFTVNAIETDGAIKNFVKMNSDKTRIYEPKSSTRLVAKELKSCDPKLLKFRKFLNAYTQIGLDLLENFGRICTRRLVAKYRFDCHPHTPMWAIRPKPFFEPVFSRHSQFFRQLNDDYSTNQLWEDLKRVDEYGIWLHFLVNMLLPGDYNKYGYVIPKELKKVVLENKSLNIPDNWEADCDF